MPKCDFNKVAKHYGKRSNHILIEKMGLAFDSKASRFSKLCWKETCYISFNQFIKYDIQIT